MTTSMASVEWISARISCPTAGSPREFVRSVVSRRGVNGASSTSAEPPGLRRKIAWQVDLSVDRVGHLRELIDEPRDDLCARLSPAAFRQRLDRASHEHSKV